MKILNLIIASSFYIFSINTYAQQAPSRCPAGQYLVCPAGHYGACWCVSNGGGNDKLMNFTSKVEAMPTSLNGEVYYDSSYPSNGVPVIMDNAGRHSTGTSCFPRAGCVENQEGGTIYHLRSSDPQIAARLRQLPFSKDTVRGISISLEGKVTRGPYASEFSYDGYDIDVTKIHSLACEVVRGEGRCP